MPMTVKQLKEQLAKMPQTADGKQVVFMIDCPFCGRGSGLETIREVVLLQGTTKESQ